MSYNGSIDLISGLRPKNNGTFPLMQAKDIQTREDGTRLDAELEELKKGTGGDTSELEQRVTEIERDYPSINGFYNYMTGLAENPENDGKVYGIKDEQIVVMDLPSGGGTGANIITADSVDDLPDDAEDGTIALVPSEGTNEETGGDTSELEHRVAEVEQKCVGLDWRITELEGQSGNDYSDLYRGMDDLAMRVDDLDMRVGSVEGLIPDTSAIDQQMHNLSEQMGDVSNRMSNIEMYNLDLAPHIESLEQTTDDLGQEMQTLEGRVSELEQGELDYRIVNALISASWTEAEVLDCTDVFDFAESVAQGGILVEKTLPDGVGQAMVSRLQSGPVKVKIGFSGTTCTVFVLAQDFGNYCQNTDFAVMDGHLLYTYLRVSNDDKLYFQCQEVTTTPYTPS